MLPDKADHAAFVEAWLGRASAGSDASQLVILFERAVATLWNRAEVTLGEVTLMAILDRVLYTSSETHPFLSTLRLERTGVQFDAFRGVACEHADLREALRLVLVETLTVLGHLTAEILTPALHRELSKVTLDGSRSTGSEDDVQGARS
jgi:hypothetical protein